MNDDTLWLFTRIDENPFARRARIVVDRMIEAWQQNTPDAELGDLYVGLVSVMFADLPAEQWPIIHGRLVDELAQDPDFPEVEIWKAVEARFE